MVEESVTVSKTVYNRAVVSSDRAVADYAHNSLTGLSGGQYSRDCVSRMKTRYRLIRRDLRGGGFYCVDSKIKPCCRFGRA